MILRRGSIVALAAAGLLLGGCASAGTSGAAAGPTTSATGKQYAPGKKPSESKFTTPAKLFLAQKQYQKALDQALQGIQADSTNAQHYFLAGQAYAGLHNYAAADSMYDRAQQIYPAYEMDIEPLREQAWTDAFNAGVEAYNANNMDSATVAWQNANVIYDKRPEAYQNLAAIYTQNQNYDKAVQAYQEGLAALDRTPATRQLTADEQADRTKSRATMEENLANLLAYTKNYAAAEKLYRQQLAADLTNVGLKAKLAGAIAAQPGREAEAQAMYTQLLAEPNLSANDLMDIGVALFNAKQYPEAAKAFKRVADQRPNARDAWYNYANALYAGNQFQELVPVAEKLVTLDPLNEDADLILARAYKEAKQNQKALQVLTKDDALPIKVKQLQMQVGDSSTTVKGQVVGNKAAPGTSEQLEFTFYGPNGTTLGTQTVTVQAPAKDQTANFQVELQNATPATGYSYRLVK